MNKGIEIVGDQLRAGLLRPEDLSEPRAGQLRSSTNSPSPPKSVVGCKDSCWRTRGSSTTRQLSGSDLKQNNGPVATIDSQILSASAVISGNIETLARDRGLLAQNILSQLRNLVEAMAVRLHTRNGSDTFHYDLVKPALDWLGSGKKQINFLHRFHKLLQMSASHYTLDGDASERLMLKYYESLLRIRTLAHDQCSLTILENLEKFPVDLDQSLKEYHQKISERIEAVRNLSPEKGARRRYYIHKVRPFFINNRIYYEITFSNAINRVSKFDRLIAFTDIDMTDRYAASLTVLADSIEVLGRTMPIFIIQHWEVSIRPCEFNNFARIFGLSTSVKASLSEYQAIMSFLTTTESSLLDLMDTSEERYAQLRDWLTQKAKTPVIFPALDAARRVIQTHVPSVNVLRYLLLEMNNRIIKLQYNKYECNLLSDLRLSASCKPFDVMPFCTSLVGHNPRFVDLAAAIDANGRTHELLARRVTNNVERHGQLYTPESELQDLGSVSELVAQYNGRIYYKHTGRYLVRDKQHVVLKQYEDETVDIIERLRATASSGVAGHEGAVNRWLDENSIMDDELKKEALKALFIKSRVALIYGAAGTGKTTMANYIANYFGDSQKLFLAHTHPAKDNLERKVSARNCEFRTVASQASKGASRQEFDVLLIDECSTVSNSDLIKVLDKTSFKLLVLIGDVYQIESIQFGNWFSIMRSFLPRESVFELTRPFRTTNERLLDFWTKVRQLEVGIEELIAQNGYSTVLDHSLFEQNCDDEIILCLNYDGLYGINNVNRFLQSSNPSEAVYWDVTIYKVGDPILFNESERFKPLLYNNLKGRIVHIVRHADRIQFDVWLDRSVTELQVDGIELRYVGESTVSFDVYPQSNTDEDDDSVNTAVPFQVAYAVSIHKAQGLEYDSVKVVITEANEEDISHNIFYTAITRTRQHLRIFWTPETQMAVLSSLKDKKKNDKDVALLKARRNIT